LWKYGAESSKPVIMYTNMTYMGDVEWYVTHYTRPTSDLFYSMTVGTKTAVYTNKENLKNSQTYS
jgi:hypothetical protein